MAYSEPRDIFRYIPNKIGYLRVVTALISFITMTNYPLITVFFYGMSCLLDAVDGFLARKYNQCSKFGAVLDMVADRSTTSALICWLSSVYPRQIIIFQVLLALDLSSHYMHMNASLQSGRESHKSVDENSSKILYFYYSRRDVLFCVCAFNELFYLGLYLMHFHKLLTTIGKYIVILCFPGFAFKQYANMIQLIRASYILAQIDSDDVNQTVADV
ncbi:hypothetical protein TPHA_0D02940 [Tetrapisispora phaffii CBS 4417]|uniref:CDP-diacylglycerol--inositol 3-phosphatidyltransferase n=1 Tax=Tetrapisispora phaffii (strain ATCC 24235 / CBS 4417 / NBRC 1672 / NRRL Y-8282 / UCD 70-5) TaxID=1071381 RepID=G8BSV9_TETPH|nr:hypothetical protein TPHA_0D02940 [Tetrapisispora phaffii CBS 4417]CCE62930.1 hypothetical protein TPHA_0D02940 [Tetrapisispora phaffii CBS 4417]